MLIASISNSSCIQKIKEIALLPFHLVANVIRFIVRKIFGVFLRIAVFQLGEYKKPVPYYIMRAYQLLNCDPRERRSLSRERIENSKTLMYTIGGVEAVAIPSDGKAQIRYMKFRSKDAFRMIDEWGGEKREIYWRNQDGEIERRHAIFPKPSTGQDQFDRLCKVLSKFSLHIHDAITDTTGRVQKGILLPHAIDPIDGLAPCILRCHSPGRSMHMDRTFLRILFAGCDLYIFDPRGTIDSTGTPSEGGYYLDTKAVFSEIVKDGYPYEKIYASGYCEGAAMAAKIAQEYHRQGVHYIAENPFNTLRDMIRAQNALGRWIADTIITEIQSKDPSITSRVYQDGFDNEKKLRNLTFSQGKFILIHTRNDMTNPKHSIHNLIRAIGRAGPLFVRERIHPDPRVNGHMQPPSEDERTWRWMAQLIA